LIVVYSIAACGMVRCWWGNRVSVLSVCSSSCISSRFSELSCSEITRFRPHLRPVESYAYLKEDPHQSVSANFRERAISDIRRSQEFLWICSAAVRTSLVVSLSAAETRRRRQWRGSVDAGRRLRHLLCCNNLLLAAAALPRAL